MRDELWMRTWNEGHDRFSTDITRGLRHLGDAFARLGRWIAPANLPGTDSFFARAAVRCGLRAASN